MILMTMLDVHQYLERLANLIRSQTRRAGGEYDLQPVHLTALYYFSVCNRYSDTLLALAEYLGQTRGTTSQTLKLLEERGLISREIDALDRRVAHLKLTAEGKAVLHWFWPSPVLTAAESLFGEPDQKLLHDLLKQLLTACQKTNQQKTFAACKTCRHNEQRGSAYFCLLTQEPLSQSDVDLICREHEYPEAG